MKNLAIHGGQPVRKSFLTYGRQCISKEDIQAVVEVLKSEFLTTGPQIDKFEEKMKAFIGVNYAVAVSNGTAALHCACLAAGVSTGDEVITTPITFAASANAVLYCGGKPIFADVDPKTMNIDIDSIEKKITSKTKAIIVVDYTGQVNDMDRIMNIAKRHNLLVIEDAAHALGSTYNGVLIGSQADMTTFSFHPVKHITTGEGGMITTNNETLCTKLKLYRSHGITRDKELLLNHENASWYYEQQDLGYNYRITDIQCALGVSQMNRIDEFIRTRRALVQLYESYLVKIPEIRLPYQAAYSNSSWHLYVIRLRLELLTCDRNTIIEALRAENIGVNLHYIPVYLHPYYQSLGYNIGECRNAEEIYGDMITIPLHHNMDQDDVLLVYKALEKVINYYRKGK